METERVERVPLDCWAVVEVMGHNKFAGRVTEHVIGAAAFVRGDVPPAADRPAFTKLLGAGSIYAITPVEELVARGIAAKLGQMPVSVWDIPQPWLDRIQEERKPFALPLFTDDDDTADDEPFGVPELDGDRHGF